MSLIISKKGQKTEKVDKSDFEKENYLQNYIHENPESIPIYEIEKGKKLFVVKREFPTNSGPIDALAVDKDGDIYVIETKLFKNPDKRAVVAQALDYGSALWRHFNDFQEFINILDSECQRNFSQTFEEKLVDFFKLEEEGLQIQLDTIKRNLSDGNLKFVILMDSMEEKLKDLIIYINQNSQFDIYAVQLEYYRFNDYEIMIPKMFGVEVKKNVKGSYSGTRRKWTEEDFIIDCREKLGNDSERIIKMYEFFKEKSDKINWGTGNINGSYSPIFKEISSTISPFSFYSNGRIMIKFNWLKDSLSESKIVSLVDFLYNNLKEKSSIKISKEEFFKREPIIEYKDFIDNYDEISEMLKEFIKKFT